METKITKVYKGKDGKEISSIDFIANTGTMTDKNVEQHVHVKTEKSGSGRNQQVSTSTSYSYTTRITMDDENGESHEVTLPGKNFACPHNGLVSFISLKKSENNSGPYYSVFTHHNEQIYAPENSDLPSDLDSIPRSAVLLALLGVLIGFCGGGYLVFDALTGYSSKFAGTMTLAGICAVVGVLLCIPYHKAKSKFMEFLREGNTELTVMVHERTKGIKNKTVNPNLDALRELGATESQTLAGEIVAR